MIYLLAYIYMLSAWRVWWWVRMAIYHPNGIHYGSEPGNKDYFGVFFPIVNVVYAFLSLFYSWKVKQANDNNIFKPKKPLT